MSDDRAEAGQVGKEIERIASRFWDLSGEAEIESDGFTQIAVGLSALAQDLAKEGLSAERMEVLARGLDALADLMVETRPAKAGTAAPRRLEQFVEGFKLEAQKRLAGLSISMMGIFNDGDRTAAIQQSAQHLHAIKGGAAMLGLKPVASLSGAMEELILSLRRREDPNDWPVKPLLRAFAVLKSAIEDNEFVDVLAKELVEELRGHFAAEDSNTANYPSVARHLEQRILVVDDMETIAASVGFILSELDIPVDLAHDADTALKMLHENAYSLVVSDVTMPGMDGFDLVRAIRDDDALVDIPVILLTQLDTKEGRAEGMNVGADDYIVKGSIGGGELVGRVNELLAEAPYVPAQSESYEEPSQLLIVEDTETIAASIAFVLSEGAYEITLAHDGQDALHKLKRKRFDLVISDVEMPSMNGFELVEAMRSDIELAGIPVIMLTSRDLQEDRKRAKEAGANRYLIKGEVPADDLLRIVARLLEGL